MIFHTGHREDLSGWEAAAGKQWSADAIARGLAEVRNELAGHDAINSPDEISDIGEAYIYAAKTARDQGIISGSPEIYDRTVRQGRRCSAAHIFLSTPPANLTIRTDTTVRKIQIEGNRATGVSVGDESSQEIIFATNSVVLAAGAIASPQLLMLSGVGPGDELRSHGITPIVDLPAVGHNLADHLAMPVIFSTPARAAFPSDWSMQQLARWNYLGRGPIGSNLAEAGGFFDLPDTAEFSQLGENQRRRGIQLHVTPTHYLRYPQPDSQAAMTIAVTASQPSSRGRIRIRSGNPLDPPSIDPGYLNDPVDTKILVEGVAIARRIAGAAPLASLIGEEVLPGSRRSTFEAIEKSIRRFSMTLYHPVGSCQMGTDIANSVVDPNLHVHGLEGLSIADASIFPTIPRANPMALVMMVANRLKI